MRLCLTAPMLAILLGFLSNVEAWEPVQAPPPHAPPTPPPIETRTGHYQKNYFSPTPLAGETLYSIGQPTDEEQYYVELINRARATPTAEGVRLATTSDPNVLGAISYYSVNLSVLQTEFGAIPIAPPLSINAALTAAARGHSGWMFTNAVQEHTGSGGSNPGDRMTNAGYSWNTWGENIFSYAQSVFHGHAGFEIDWGVGSDGMQGPPRGHRVAIHNSAFREIGVGVRNGINTVITNGVTNTVGPQLVTQDLATAANAQPFVTGVVYYDLNTNNFYDPGEGIGGITVAVTGSSFYAVTANSGGYSVPVPNANTTRAMQFSGLGFDFSTNATIANLANVKMDFTPTYTPPALTGPAQTLVGTPAHYTLSPVAGATQYEWQYAEKKTALAEPCENLTNVLTNTSGYYNVLDTQDKDTGAASFHLAHPIFATQTITLTKTYYPQGNSTLQFRSRLGLATPDQIARVQVALAGANEWADIYTQGGTSTSGELVFNTRIASLAAYAGKFIKIRFAYTVTGSAYTQTTSGVGWYIDGISFPNTSEIENSVPTGIGAATTFDFTPPSAGTFLLSVRPLISDRYWKDGPIKEITATSTMIYADWITHQYPTVVGGAKDDDDKDGLSNLIEYAFGFNPTQPTSNALLPQPVITGTTWQVTYTTPTGVTGITYGAQWSTNMVNWVNLTDSGSGSTHTFSFDAGAAKKVFFRHRVVLSP